MATHSSILAWEIPWTGVPGGLQSMMRATVHGTARVSHNLATKPPPPHTHYINLYCTDSVSLENPN